jgi:hypothetical protein
MLGWYPNLFAAAFTRSRVTGGIDRPGELFSTNDTVAGLRSRYSASIFRLTRRPVSERWDVFFGIDGNDFRNSLAETYLDATGNCFDRFTTVEGILKIRNLERNKIGLDI